MKYDAARSGAPLEGFKETCPPKKLLHIRTQWVELPGPIVMDVLEPLYEKHPELKPPNWDE